MPGDAKRVVIEIERTETRIVRIASGAQSVTTYCDQCHSETQMLDLNAAVTFSGRNAHELIHEIETGSLHSAQSLRGHLLICTISLQTPFETQE